MAIAMRIGFVVPIFVFLVHLVVSAVMVPQNNTTGFIGNRFPPLVKTNLNQTVVSGTKNLNQTVVSGTKNRGDREIAGAVFQFLPARHDVHHSYQSTVLPSISAVHIIDMWQNGTNAKITRIVRGHNSVKVQFLQEKGKGIGYKVKVYGP